MHNKWVWISVMAVILLGGALGGVLLLTAVCEPEPVPPCPSGLICATSGEMCDNYAENVVTADALYKGQNLRVSGRVITVQRAAGNTYLELACPGVQNLGLRCFFTTENENLLTGIVSGEDVLVVGVGSGYQTFVQTGFTYNMPIVNQVTSVERY